MRIIRFGDDDDGAPGGIVARQRTRQPNVELPLIVSDHADWDELIATIQEIAPSEVWVTHGHEEALVHWCMTRQIKVVTAENNPSVDGYRQSALSGQVSRVIGMLCLPRQRFR